MTCFEMVKYHSQSYPADIPLRTEEIAAHFDITSVDGYLGYSLHTEYSYGKRKFDSVAVLPFDEIVSAQKDGVPQLWKSERWSEQFSQFIISLTKDKKIPEVIEVHPPFADYTDFEQFGTVYKIFEDNILAAFPDVKILIENRCGSVYHGGKFLVSKIADLQKLCEQIDKLCLRLKIAFDVPQIYTAHNASTQEKFCLLLDNAAEMRQYIGGVHLWGKSKSSTGRKVSHCGDLNTYFGSDQIKQAFLQKFATCFDDGTARKMVLEVNSGSADLLSIVSDLRRVGVQFI